MTHSPGHSRAQEMVDSFDPLTGPSMGPGVEEPRYLGVPRGYVVPGRAPASPRQADRAVSFPRFPRYTEADIYTPRNLGPEYIAPLQEQLKAAGLYSSRARYVSGRWDVPSQDAYQRLLEYANQGGISDLQALQELLTDPATGRALSGQDLEDAPFTGTRKRRNKSVDLTNPQSARAALRSVLREELGRAPREDEVQAFVAALNASERANPVITDQTMHIVEDELTGTDSVSSGGVDPAAFMQEFIETDPELSTERNTFTVATDYYDAVMRAIGGGS